MSLVEMSEKEAAKELVLSWNRLISDYSPKPLTDFLKSNSGLPGPRGNLTLAAEVSKLIASYWATKREFLKETIIGWSKSGDEYLMFVAYSTIGYVLSRNPSEDDWAVPILYEANFSRLWRAREGVTIALEALLEDGADFTLGLIEDWCISNNPIVVRNSIVALAHPTQLRRNQAQLDALERYNGVGMGIIAEVADLQDDTKMLAKSLGFTISVAAEADEDYLDELDRWINDPVKAWRPIIRENLTKARIRKKYPRRVEALLKHLG
jgi:hypothetical protein